LPARRPEQETLAIIGDAGGIDVGSQRLGQWVMATRSKDTALDDRPRITRRACCSLYCSPINSAARQIQSEPDMRARLHIGIATRARDL